MTLFDIKWCGYHTLDRAKESQALAFPTPQATTEKGVIEGDRKQCDSGPLWQQRAWKSAARTLAEWSSGRRSRSSPRGCATSAHVPEEVSLVVKLMRLFSATILIQLPIAQALALLKADFFVAILGCGKPESAARTSSFRCTTAMKASTMDLMYLPGGPPGVGRAGSRIPRLFQRTRHV